MLLRYLRPAIIIIRNCSSNFKTHDKIVLNYLKRQSTDEFSKEARAHNYRARSAFKLLEINEKFHIIRKNDVVLDAGAAPGSWSQVVSEILFHDNSNLPSTSASHCGYILGVDLQPIFPIKNVDLICPANITYPSTHAEIHRRLAGRQLTVVLSDMAPNPTGNSSMDHERLIGLCRVLFRLISPLSSDQTVLPMASGGRFLCKIWDGPQKRAFVDELSTSFKHVRTFKPKASRDNSAETYIYASGYNHL